MSQSQLAIICSWAICNNITFFNPLPFIDDGLLIKTGILIGSLVFNQGVNINASIAFFFLGTFALDDDSRCIDAFNNPGPLCNHYSP
ncbi:MAG: hypothetical protein A4E66_01343 [Syntrophus sp. PtaB.Bin001]|nr:MAG: hypothetical protein A4E66_01343 [Syntrophus sp. PtaB.Bin001]